MIKKHLVTVAEMLIIFALILIVSCILNHMYFKPDEWSRILWHNFYNEKKNIDNLYLGSSHVFCDIDPTILDKLNGNNNFNLATSSQLLNGTFYLLKEANRTNNLKYVYVELNYDVSTGREGFKSSSNLISNWRNTDYMKLSLNWIEYAMEMSDMARYPETIFPFLRFKGKALDVGYIRGQMIKKKNKMYKNYEFKMEDDSETKEYRAKGYCYSDKEIAASDLFCNQAKIFENEPMTNEAEGYLRRIIEYCISNDLDITLFSSPIYDLQLLSLENYDAYINQINAIAEEYGIEYLDFNLCKEEFLPIQERQYFTDMQHLNGKGAEIFTPFFHKVMCAPREMREKYFYSSYKEKNQKSKTRLIGIIYLYMSDKGSESRYVRIASNKEKGIEYQILFTPESGETSMVQEFSDNRDFSILLNQKGTYTISAKEKDSQVIQSLEYVY